MGGPLRYPNSVVFWVQCDQNVLDERCNKRVDKMVERGLIHELEDFHRVIKRFYNIFLLKEIPTSNCHLSYRNAILFVQSLTTQWVFSNPLDSRSFTM